MPKRFLFPSNWKTQTKKRLILSALFSGKRDELVDCKYTCFFLKIIRNFLEVVLMWLRNVPTARHFNNPAQAKRSVGLRKPYNTLSVLKARYISILEYCSVFPTRWIYGRYLYPTLPCGVNRITCRWHVSPKLKRYCFASPKWKL